MLIPNLMQHAPNRLYNLFCRNKILMIELNKLMMQLRGFQQTTSISCDLTEIELGHSYSHKIAYLPSEDSDQLLESDQYSLGAILTAKNPKLLHATIYDSHYNDSNVHSSVCCLLQDKDNIFNVFECIVKTNTLETLGNSKHFKDKKLAGIEGVWLLWKHSKYS